MKTAHTPTPGKWVANGVVVTALQRDGIYCSDIALTSLNSYEESNGIPRAQQEANARLIAAAPDLDQALDELLTYMDGYERDWNHDEPLPAFEKARTALAKARGE